MSLTNLPPLLSLKDAFLAVGASALTTHYIFKRWEPHAIPVVVTLLIVLPLALSFLLHGHYSWFTAIPLSFLTYYATLASSISLYRLSPFHPLAKYPGPFKHRLSQFFILKATRTGKRHLYIQQLHEKYGDIVRIGPNEVSIRDVSAIGPLMGTNGWPKGPFYLGHTMGPQPIPAMITIRDPALHAKRRRPWNRAFSTAALKEYEPLIAHRVSQLVEKLVSDKGPVDLARYISYFTYDFMGDMVFGGWYEMLRDGDKDKKWELMEASLKTTSTLENIPWITYFIRHVPSVASTVKKHRASALAKGAERRAQGSKTKDLFYYLNNDDGVEPEQSPEGVVVADAVLAVIAGSDTTASVLSNIFYSLLRYPDTYKRLQAEIDHYYPVGEDPTNPKHYPKMTFLDAVLNETLRLYPAVPSGSQRAAQPGVASGGKVVGPYYLPEGTQARIHFYSVHRDARNFYPHPDSFWPNRWLVAEGEEPAPKDFRHNPSAFIPFSFGPYNCVGKNLALQEMRVVVCAILQNLELRFAEGWDINRWNQELEDRFVTKKGSLPVVVTRRH